MKTFQTCWQHATATLLFAILVDFPTTAWSCPTCKDGLGENYVSAYAFSIVFMMTVPYLILTWFFAYLWFARRRNGSGDDLRSASQQLSDLAERKAAQGIPTQPPAWDS